jgi:hypothetical protein
LVGVAVHALAGISPPKWGGDWIVRWNHHAATPPIEAACHADPAERTSANVLLVCIVDRM